MRCSRSITRAPSASLLLLPMLATLAGCGDDPVRPADLPVCEGSVDVTVSRDPVPVISWQPACRLSYLNVRRAVGPFASGTVWELHSPDRLLAPGMGYGLTPASAQVVTPAAPLGRDTSYFVNVGFRSSSDFATSITSIGGLGITACGELSGGTCVTTKELFRDVTREGVRVTAAVSPAATDRGDTAWVTFRATNPTAQPVTVQTTEGCWTWMWDLHDAQGKSPLGARLVTCSDPFNPVEPLTVPAGGVVEMRVPFDGVLALNGGMGECPAPGTYTFTVLVNAANGGRRVRSEGAALTLREKAATRTRCLPA